MMNLLKDKKILFMARYGSYNYNLNTVNSDIDWRGFSNIVNEKSVDNFGIDNNDICINNTRYLYKALTEMKPKHVELLFSDAILISDNISKNSKKLIKKLFLMKNDIALMDLKQMYNGYLKEYNLHQQWIYESKNPNHNKNYQIHSFRILDILIRFAYTNFEDYKYAIFYSNEDASRNIILNFKSTKISATDFQSAINEKYKIVLTLESKFNKKVNLSLIKQLKNIIEEISLEEVR